MAARLIRRASRLLAVPLSFQPAAAAPAECLRLVQLAPGRPSLLHTSAGRRLSDILPEISPMSAVQDDEKFYAMLKDLPGVEELLELASKEKLGCNKVVMVIQQLTLKAGGHSEAVVEDPRFQEILKNLNKKIQHIWNVRLLKLLKCLYDLKLSQKDRFLQSVEIEVQWRLRRFTIGSLSYLASFITPTSRSTNERSLFNDLVLEVELRWTEIKDTRTLVSLICRLGSVSDSLMEKLEDKVLEFADKFTPGQSRRIISLLATQNRRTLSVLRALSFHLLQHKLELTPSIIVDLAFAYGSLNFCYPQVLQKMATDLMPRLAATSSSDISLVIRSFASLKFPNRSLCEAVAQECLERGEAFSVPQICSVLLGFAYLNFQPSKSEKFFNMILNRLDSEFDSLKWPLQLNSVWALCVLNHVTPSYLQKILEPQFYQQILEENSIRSTSHCLKLMNVNATALLESPGYQGPLLPDDVLQALQKKIKLRISRNMQEGAADVLKAIFPTAGSCSFGINTIYGSYLDGEVILDSEFKALPVKDFVAPHNPEDGGTQPLPEGVKRLAIVTREFSHYTFRGKDLLGQYMMNQRHLEAAGFKVVEVPYYDWQEIKSDWQKQYFLKEQIKKAVAGEAAL